MSEEFCIVVFPEENDSVGIIPTSWIIKNREKLECFYPPCITDEKRDKLVEKQAKPGSNWATYPIRILYKYDSYTAARARLGAALVTSDLEEETENCKRKRFARVIYDPDDEGLNHRPAKKTSLFSNLPPKDSFKSVPIEKESNKQESSSDPNLLHPTSNRSSPQSFSPIRLSPINNNPYRNHISSMSPTGSYIPNSYYPAENSYLPSPSPYASHNNQDMFLQHRNFYPASLSRLERKIDALQQTMEDIAGGLHNINKKLNFIIQDEKKTEERVENSEENSTNMFPLCNMENFASVELKLKDNSIFRKNVMKMLGSVGGRERRATINNMMRRLLLDNVAQNFNWSGKTLKNNRKTAFKGTEMCRCIFDTCKVEYEDATEDKMKDEIGDWLHQARTRLSRNEKKQAQNIVEANTAPNSDSEQLVNIESEEFPDGEANDNEVP